MNISTVFLDGFVALFFFFGDIRYGKNDNDLWTD